MAQLAATPAAPVITSVQCTTGGTKPVFSLVWIPQQGFTGPFSVLVTSSSGTSVTGTTTSASANGAIWTATDAMSAGDDTYTAQVAVTGNESIVSDPVPLLFAPVTGIVTYYDGSLLTIGWTTPASATPSGETQVLLLTPSGAQATVSTSGTFAQMEVDPNLRTAEGSWSVYLTPQFGISSGPQSDASAVYHDMPLVESAQVLGIGGGSAGTIKQANLSLAVTVQGVDTPDSALIAVLMTSGKSVMTTEPITADWQWSTVNGMRVGQCTITAALDYPFNLGTPFEVAVAQSSAQAGVTVGPVGIGTGLVLLGPQTLTAKVSASGKDRLVELDTLPLPGPFALTGAQMALIAPDGTATIGDIGLGFGQTMSLSSPTVGGAYQATLRLASGANTGPWADNTDDFPGTGTPVHGLPLVTSLPVFDAIAIDAGVASLSWSSIPDQGVTGYQITATIGSAVMASGIFTGTSASMPVSAGDGLAFAIAGISSACTGPAGTPIDAITSPPLALASTWLSSKDDGTLNWQPPAEGGVAPDGYTIEIYNGEIQVKQDTATTTSYALPANLLNAAGGYSYRVRATKSGSPALSGPWSDLVPVVAAAPQALAVDYDGATLSVSWKPVAGATGYRLALVEDGAESGDPWYSSIASSAISLDFDGSKVYSVAIQGIGPGSTGPATSAAVFGSGLYPQLTADTAAALIPASIPSMAPHAIAIGLPQIFTTAPDPGDLPSTAPFALTQADSPYAYVLTLAGVADQLPWRFTADAIRADLYTSYTTFLDQLETLGATAFGIQTVQSAIARAMPQTFVETLLYSYGFRGDNGWVDLRPGMLLRAEYESYQTMGGSTADQAYLNGFITSSVAEYQITRSANQAAGFTTLDAFIGWLTALGGTSVTTPPVSNRKQAGGGGLIDSGYTLMQQPFLRLVYPQGFADTNQIGTPYPEFNALLLAAPSLSALNTATTNVRSAHAAGTDIGVLYFRGRTTLIPQARIWVNGVEERVSLGTTVSEILAGRAMEPSAVNLPLTGIDFMRGIGPALVGSPASYDTGAGMPVRLDWAPMGHAALGSLPLLGGDRISFVDTSTS